jgi:hypothetical protein
LPTDRSRGARTNHARLAGGDHRLHPIAHTQLHTANRFETFTSVVVGASMRLDMFDSSQQTSLVDRPASDPEYA